MNTSCKSNQNEGKPTAVRGNTEPENRVDDVAFNREKPYRLEMGGAL